MIDKIIGGILIALGVYIWFKSLPVSVGHGTDVIYTCGSPKLSLLGSILIVIGLILTFDLFKIYLDIQKDLISMSFLI